MWLHGSCESFSLSELNPFRERDCSCHDCGHYCPMLPCSSGLYWPGVVLTARTAVCATLWCRGFLFSSWLCYSASSVWFTPSSVHFIIILYYIDVRACRPCYFRYCLYIHIYYDRYGPLNGYLHVLVKYKRTKNFLSGMFLLTSNALALN